MLGLWGMRSTPSLPLLPGPLWPWMVTLDRALSMGWIELNCILMQNWILWIRTVWLNWIAWKKKCFWLSNCVLIFKLHTYAKLNCLKWNCFWHLTVEPKSIFIIKWIGWIWTVWIAWNRNVFDSCALMVNWIVWNITDYLYKIN